MPAPRPGACSRGLRAASEISKQAQRSCRAEIDAAPYATLAFLSAPQLTTAARELLREAARRHGFLAVDLRDVFAEHAGPGLPGRRLFLDYCHLTLEGIQVAMAAVAAEVLNLSGMIEETSGLAEPPPPPPRSRDLPGSRGHGPLRRRHPHRPPPAGDRRQASASGALVRGGARRLARHRGGDARPRRRPLRPLPRRADRRPAAQPRLPLPPHPPARLALGPPRRRPDRGDPRRPGAPGAPGRRASSTACSWSTSRSARRGPSCSTRSISGSPWNGSSRR